MSVAVFRFGRVRDRRSPGAQPLCKQARKQVTRRTGQLQAVSRIFLLLPIRRHVPGEVDQSLFA